MKEKHRHIALFPCRLKIIPDCVFNARDPIVMGVKVEEGVIRQGTILLVKARGKSLRLYNNYQLRILMYDRIVRPSDRW
jgi:translation initiation factor 5B